MFSNKPHSRSVAARAHRAAGAFLFALFASLALAPDAAAQREEPDPVWNSWVTDKTELLPTFRFDPPASFGGCTAEVFRYNFNRCAPSIPGHGESGRAQQVTIHTYSGLLSPAETYTLPVPVCRGGYYSGCTSPRHVSTSMLPKPGDDDEVLNLRVSWVGTTTLNLRGEVPAETSLAGKDGWRLRLGSRIADSPMALHVELAGEHRESGAGEDEQVLRLDLGQRF